MRKLVLLYVGLLLLPLLSTAQSAKKLRNNYEYAKELIGAERYQQAMKVLKPITAASKNNYLDNYAGYLYSYAAYKADSTAVAKKELNRLITENSNWNKIDEAKYLLGIVQIEEGAILDGLRTLETIRNSSFNEQIKKAKAYSFNSLSAEKVSQLLLQSPDDTSLGTALLEKMERMEEEEIDLPLYSILVDRFGDEGREYRHLPKIVFKEEYNIVALLPYFTDLTDPTLERTNNWFVYDLFQGMQVGKEILEEEGIKVNLYAFDTEKDLEATRKILQDSALHNADLIVGPLFAEPLAAVKEFSTKYGVPVLNPITSSTKPLAENENSFLLSASYPTLGKQVANFSYDSLLTEGAFIIYGGSDEEKEMAKAYKKQYEKRGGQVVRYEQFDYSANGFNSLLSVFDTIKMDSLGEVHYNGHVFVAIRDEIPAVNVTSALQNLRTTAPVFVPENWAEFKQVRYGQLEAINAYLYSPHYVDYEDDSVKAVISRYTNTYVEVPSEYALDGIEAVYFFGKMMHQFGTGFKEKIHEIRPQKGLVYSGYFYGEEKDNQYVPIVNFKLKQGETELVNPMKWNTELSVVDMEE